jgi:SAM-dependent methyltransferase
MSRPFDGGGADRGGPGGRARAAHRDGEPAPKGAPAAGGVFAADWLRLREPVDHRSRAEALIVPLVREWRRRGWSRIVDLGSGAGSNMRYLAPRLPGPQRWTAIDHDADLLAGAVVPPEAGTPTAVQGDLEREGLRAIGAADLVAGAALLDLVSEAWLRAAAAECRRAGAGALFTTIYDGTIRWEEDGAVDVELAEADELIRDAVNAHQGRDKGLGTALGPAAGPAARRLFHAVGHRTRSRPSPWVLGPVDRPLVLELMAGWANAAREQEPRTALLVDRWMERRTRSVSSGDFQLTVGHLDVLALPVGSRPAPTEPRP